MTGGGVHGGVIDTARFDFQIHSYLIAVKAGGDGVVREYHRNGSWEHLGIIELYVCKCNSYWPKEAF